MDDKKENSALQPHAVKIMGKLKKNRESLYIERVPPKTKKAFQDLAQKEFCGDYGMLLKWLMDDILSADTRLILAKIENHEVRIASLENALKAKVAEPKVEEEPKVRKMLDGSLRRVRA